MTEQHSCQLCMRSHPLRHCRKFISMTPNERDGVIHEYGYCRNCLARSHSTKSCDSPNTCKECGLTHHTMLHPLEGQAQGQSQSQSQAENSTNSPARRRPRRGNQTGTGPSKRGTQNRKPYNNQGPSRRAQPKAQPSATAQVRGSTYPNNLPSLMDLFVQPQPQPIALLDYSYLIQRPPVLNSTAAANQGYAAASYANGRGYMIPGCSRRPEPPSPPNWN